MVQVLVQRNCRGLANTQSQGGAEYCTFSSILMTKAVGWAVAAKSQNFEQKLTRNPGGLGHRMHDTTIVLTPNIRLLCYSTCNLFSDRVSCLKLVLHNYRLVLP